MNSITRKIVQLTFSLALAGLFGVGLLAGVGHNLPPVYAQTDTCFVETTGDNTTDYQSADATAVQQAINAATAGDVIKIAGTCAGVTQTGIISQTAYISQSLTLQGGYTTTNWLAAPDPDTYPTVLDAQNQGRVIYNKLGTTAVTLAGLTIQHGVFPSDAGGGVAHFGASMVISQSRIISNTAGFGGGIYNDAVLTVTHSTIASNSVTTVGGGIAQDGGTLTVLDSLISGNSADGVDGVGGGVQDDDNAGTMTFINSTIRNNHSAGNGGGVWDKGGSLTLLNSIVQENQATSFGGGIYKSYGTLTLTGTHILSNSTPSSGGGIYQDFDTLTLSDSLISGNTAEKGGGIDYYLASVTIVSTTLQYNQAITTSGGGINNQAGALTLLNSTLQHNQAKTTGGGIDGRGAFAAVISNTTLYSNTAGQDGGGIYNSSTLTATNSTFSANIANSGGGGFYNTGSVALIHTTFFTNSADGGMAFANFSGTVVLTSTIVAGSDNFTCFNSGGTVTATHSLFQVATCGFSDEVNGNIVGEDPLLGPLADNGGETETHALLTGSPAIDAIPAGDCAVSTDQRGVTRPQGDNCDIGAVENSQAIIIYLPLVVKNNN